MPEFAQGFRLHPRSGPALDGAAFPSDRVFVLDDPEFGLATVAFSLEELLRGGYDGARIEWADEAQQSTNIEERPEDAAARFARRCNAVERLCSGRPGYHTITVKALLTAMGAADDEAEPQPCAEHSDAPVISGLCGGCTQYGETLPGTPTVADWAGEQQGPAVSGGNAPRPTSPETGLPPEQPCTDPRHTGAIREQLGCTGPDPATT